MNPRVMMDLQDVPALNDADSGQSSWSRGRWHVFVARRSVPDADSVQPSWSRRGRQDLPYTTISQRKPPLVSTRADIVKINDIMMSDYHGTGSKPHLAEPPKVQEWPRPCIATLPDSEIRVLVVGALTDPVTWDHAAAWSEAAMLTFDPEILADMLYELFRGANGEVFEDGMDSGFSNNLSHIIRTHGIAAVNALERIMHMNGVNPEVVAEALVWAGRMNDETTHRARLSVLERALESPNVCIRDAASIGIGAMDDPAAMGSLQKAIGRERCVLLRQNLKDTLEQLKEPR